MSFCEDGLKIFVLPKYKYDLMCNLRFKKKEEEEKTGKSTFRGGCS